MRLCAWLRWKAYYGARWEDPAALTAALARGETAFSCLRTCQPWGPDDDLCAPERCQPDRPCFEPSPKDPGAPVA